MAINNFVEDFMRGLQQGQQRKQAEQAELDAQEDRKMRKVLLQHQLRTMGIEDKLRARALAKENYGMVDGKKSENDYAITEAGFQQTAPNQAATLPGGMAMPGQSFGLQAKRDIPAMQLPGVEELGVEGVSMQPRTLEDVMRQQAEAELAKPFNLAPGAARFAGGQRIAENPVEAKPVNLQTIETVIDGRPTVATFNPQTGEVKPIAGARPYEPPRRAAAGAGGGAPATTQGDQTMDGLADMVMSNPETLKSLPSKDRGLVLRHIASSGGQMPNKRREAVNTMVDAALASIADLGLQADGTFRAPEGFSGAIGAKGASSLFGLKSTPVAGTAAASIAAKVDALRAQVTLPQLEFLKGLGAMSDREFATIQSSVTALNRDMREEDFVKELGKIAGALKTAKARINAGASLQVDGPITIGGFKVEIDK